MDMIVNTLREAGESLMSVLDSPESREVYGKLALAVVLSGVLGGL